MRDIVLQVSELNFNDHTTNNLLKPNSIIAQIPVIVVLKVHVNSKSRVLMKNQHLLMSIGTASWSDG